MRFVTIAVSAVALLASFVSSEREQEFATARIFLQKSTSSKFPLIVGSDFVVNYVVSNNGEAPATTLVLSDRYDPSSFELIENVAMNGTVSFSIKELAPGALVSVSLTTCFYHLHGTFSDVVRFQKLKCHGDDEKQSNSRNVFTS